MRGNSYVPFMLRRGDGSTLSLDFTAMSSLDSRFTFSRSSATSTYINSSGLVTTAGTNVPRFDYDPSTLAPRGLLIEGGVTNLCLQSAAVRSSGWTPVGLTTQGPSITAPDGTSSGVEMVPSNGTVAGNAYSVQSVAASASTSYTLSVWIKPIGTAFNTRIRLTSLPGGTDAITATINNANGTIASLGTGTNWTSVSATSTPYPNGWYRITLTGNTPSGTTQLQIVLLFSGTGDGTTGAYFWGAQLEAGSGATSYIPTGASTVARAADSCSMTGTNFSSWYPSGTTSGTFFCQFDNSRSNLGFAINPTPIALGEYSAGNLIAGLMNTTAVGSGATISVWGSGGSGLQQSAIGATISQGNKIAFAFNGQTATGSLNGGSGTATTTGTVNAKTILFIGGSGSGTSLVRDFIVAPIQRIKFFPSVFSTAQLQSLTQ